MTKHLIFVYGTLKRGWGNNAIIADQEFVGGATTVENRFQMYSLGGYPGVIAGDKPITGEVWEVDDAAFARCDRLEGHPDFYKREEIEVVVKGQFSQMEITTAWIYIYQYELSGYAKPIDSWEH